MKLSQQELKQETDRLYEKLRHNGWRVFDCARIAPITLEINALKKKQNAIILAHSYQTPDIVYGVADFVGDSYGLSKTASASKAKKIIFCSVYFMGETAKILNPQKEVVVPVVAGCSLADAITPSQVRALRKKYPGAAVVGYVNTSAAVKAECDICCTSSNALAVIESLPQAEIIFLPDQLMGRNLQVLTSKKLILWNGDCVVHKQFGEGLVMRVRAKFPEAKILAHTECDSAVIKWADYAGSTTGMLNYLKTSPARDIMLVTECGLTDRARVEFPDKNIVGTCNLCAYMKAVKLSDVLRALKKPAKKQIIKIAPRVLKRAAVALNKMMVVV